MSDVKALYPIGKTQWRKWGDEARNAYNKSRALGFTHETGVAEANAVQAKQPARPKKNIFAIIEDVADAASQAQTIIAVAKPLIKATRGRKKVK